MRSGWRTMFGVFSAASKVSTGIIAISISIAFMTLASQNGLLAHHLK